MGGGSSPVSAETASQNCRSEWDKLFGMAFKRKVCPVLGPDSGTRFLLGMPSGKRGPF